MSPINLTSSYETTGQDTTASIAEGSHFMLSRRNQSSKSSLHDKFEPSSYSKHAKADDKSEKNRYSSEEQLWIEKNGFQPRQSGENLPKDTPVQRESWMEMPCVLETYTREQLRLKEGTSRVLKKREERRKRMEGEKPGSHRLELNPYYDQGGSGLPTAPTTSNYSADWLKKSMKRAIEQAQSEGRSLAEIAAERWGSLAKFNELMAAAEKTSECHGNNESSYSKRQCRTQKRHSYGRQPENSYKSRINCNDRARSKQSYTERSRPY